MVILSLIFLDLFMVNIQNKENIRALAYSYGLSVRDFRSMYYRAYMCLFRGGSVEDADAMVRAKARARSAVASLSSAADL